MRSFSFPHQSAEALRFIEQQFTDCFSERGYLTVEQEPIIPRNDRTLLFTNATIVPLKPRITAGDVERPGVMLTQQCLRTQNSERILQVDYDPPYMSYFRMPGVLTNPSSYEDLCVAVWEFLHDRLGIAAEDIMLRTSSQCRPFFAPWEKVSGGLGVEHDTRPEKYYNWRYGMDDVQGVGYTFAVRDGDDTFGDLGNIVQISTAGRVIAYEFGVGLETLAARMYRLRGPFEAAPISRIIPFSAEPAAKMLQDCTVVATVLYRNGIRPGTGGAQHVLKRVVKGLGRLMRLRQITSFELGEMLSSFEAIEFGSVTEQLRIDVLEDIQHYERLATQDRAYFVDFVRNQARLASQGRIVSNELLISTLRKKGLERYSLDPNTVEEIIAEHLSVRR